MGAVMVLRLVTLVGVCVCVFQGVRGGGGGEVCVDSPKTQTTTKRHSLFVIQEAGDPKFAAVQSGVIFFLRAVMFR